MRKWRVMKGWWWKEECREDKGGGGEGEGERRGEEEYTGRNNQGKYYRINNLHAQNTSTCVSVYSINC